MDVNQKDILWLCVVIAVAIIFSSFFRTQQPLGDNVSGNPLALEVRQDQSSPVTRNAAADVTLVVLADYRCPACRAAQPAMMRAVAKDGKVRIVYKDWPIFGEASERAAKIAIASDFQNIYPFVHDRLMTGRTDNDDDLKAAVELSGGDWGQLQSDLQRKKAAIAAHLGRIKLQAFQLGLGGTPGYLIGPILLRGALTENEFTRVFKQARNAP